MCLFELEDVDDGGGDLFHVVHGELAHVGDAEGFVLEAAVAVAQLHVALGEGFVELGDGDHFAAALGVRVDDGEGLGEVFLVRVDAEVLVGPGADELCHLFVAGEAVFDAFFIDDVLELFVHGVHDGEAGGGGVLVVLLVDEVPDGAQVEVEAAVLDFGGAVVGFAAHGADGHAGGQGEGFLRGGDEDVDAEFVGFDFGACGGGDGVDAPDDVRVFLHDFGDFFDGVLDAGRGFVVRDGDEVVFAGGEGGIDHFRGGGLPHFTGEFVGGYAVGLGHFEPFVAEGADGEDGGSLGGAGAYGAFHEAGAGGGGEEDAVLSEENFLHVVGNALLDFRGFFGAVADHRQTELLEDVF